MRNRTLPGTGEAGEPDGQTLPESCGVGFAEDLGHGWPAEPFGKLKPSGQVFLADLGARDVGCLGAWWDLVDRAVAVFLRQEDHLLEIDHLHADIRSVLGHGLLGGIRGIKGLAGRVVPGASMITTDDEM